MAVKKDNQAGHIYRTVTHMSVHTVVPLYKALVRQHLEYCSLVRSPYPKKGILSIERVQRRVTKIIPSISALNYDERLERIRLISLENRLHRADLLQMFEILNDFVKVDPATHFEAVDVPCPGPFHFSPIADHVYDFWVCLYLSDPYVGP